jgi:hypothetical protein
MDEQSKALLRTCPFHIHNPERITAGTKTNRVANAAGGISDTGP